MNGPSDLCFHSAVELRRMLAAGEVSALEVLDAHIVRIEKYDGALNAIVTRCFDVARRTAASGAATGPLAGATRRAQGLTETGGCHHPWSAFGDNVPAEDSLLWSRIRRRAP